MGLGNNNLRKNSVETAYQSTKGTKLSFGQTFQVKVQQKIHHEHNTTLQNLADKSNIKATPHIISKTYAGI